MSGVDASFWKGRRVLVTGHTGFKGAWASLWLVHMGAEVTGFGLAPDTTPSLFDLARVSRSVVSRFGDLRDPGAVSAAVAEARPQIVLHLAAQSLVRRSIARPVETFATNVLGTVHLLDALRDREGLQAVLVATTDKVYENRELGSPFVEQDRLGGHDPYAASKAAAELATLAMAETYFAGRAVPVATARGGNVIGGGDFAEDRLVPDVVRALDQGRELELRYPASVRPWQHVLDCLAGYLIFLQALAGGTTECRALNFGPAGPSRISVSALSEHLQAALGQRPGWRHVPATAPEARMLVLDSSRARRDLGWSDRLPGPLAVEATAAWYKALHAGEDMRTVTLSAIAAYLSGQAT